MNKNLPKNLYAIASIKTSRIVSREFTDGWALEIFDDEKEAEKALEWYNDRIYQILVYRP